VAAVIAGVIATIGKSTGPKQGRTHHQTKQASFELACFFVLHSLKLK